MSDAKSIKEADPESMKELGNSYDTTIGAARNYLKNKNRNHRNNLYRRRYDIVDELIAELENERQNLGEKKE